MVNGLQTLPQWRDYFNQPSASRLGAINAMYPVGQLIGVFPATWMSDRYGRKIPIYLGFAIWGVAAGIQGGAQNVGMFIVARLLVGISASFVGQPSPILITELAYPTQRGKLTALYYTNYVSLRFTS
jgi:MFS family permease